MKKHFQYELTFHLFMQRGFDQKKVPPAKGRLLNVHSTLLFVIHLRM